MRYTLMAVFVLAILLVACGQEATLEGNPGAEAAQVTEFATIGSSTAGGDVATYADGYSDNIRVDGGTETAIWFSCDSNIDVDDIWYELSPGAGLWVNGTTSIGGCETNTTYLELADAGAKLVRFYHDINASNATGAYTFVLTQR